MYPISKVGNISYPLASFYLTSGHKLVQKPAGILGLNFKIPLWPILQLAFTSTLMNDYDFVTTFVRMKEFVKFEK